MAAIRGLTSEDFLNGKIGDENIAVISGLSVEKVKEIHEQLNSQRTNHK